MFFTWSGLGVAIVFYVLTGLGVTVGLHRLLTHRSFETYPCVRRFWALLGTLAFQGGPLAWVAVHRLHHQHADREGDPHSPRRGFWHAQLWWYYPYDSRYADVEKRLSYVKDLAEDPVLRWLDQYFLLVQAILFGILWWIGECIQPGLGPSWAIYGVFVRIFVLQQITSLVNSAVIDGFIEALPRAMIPGITGGSRYSLPRRLAQQSSCVPLVGRID